MLSAAKGPEGEAAAIPRYEGEWNFKVHGELDMNQIRTVKVDAVGVDGFFELKVLSGRRMRFMRKLKRRKAGMRSVVLRLFVMPMEIGCRFRRRLSENYSTYQRDVSKVSVFVCDYEEYMGKLEQGYSAVSDEKDLCTVFIRLCIGFR